MYKQLTLRCTGVLRDLVSRARRACKHMHMQAHDSMTTRRITCCSHMSAFHMNAFDLMLLAPVGGLEPVGGFVPVGGFEPVGGLLPVGGLNR